MKTVLFWFMLGIWFAPLLERLLFAGNLKLWLNDHQRGSAVGGWMPAPR